MKPVVVGLGQEAAGDDAVGLAILRAFRQEQPAGLTLVESGDAADLIELCAHTRHLVLIDAVVDGGPPGRVRRLAESALPLQTGTWSTHSLTVPVALGLARELNDTMPLVDILAVSIDRPDRLSQGLSPAVAAAIEPALRMLRALLCDPPPRGPRA